MGHDWLRFIDECDEEFLCQICTMVLENPVETPCEHFFCNKCIKDWLLIDEFCPIERNPLTAADLKAPSRLLRNLLGKLNIKCDFRKFFSIKFLLPIGKHRFYIIRFQDNNGCPEIVRLESLQSHRSGCAYNPEAEVTCDKGCKLKMKRREFLEYDCSTHLKKKVNGQEAVIGQLLEKVNLQRESADRAGKEICDLKAQIANLERLLPFEKLQMINCRFSQSQRCENMTIQFGDTITLQTGDKSEFGLWQSAYAFDRSKPYFKLKILKSCRANSVVMGVARHGHASVPPGYDRGSFGYTNNGKFVSMKGSENVGDVWKENDIIKCGIKFHFDDYSAYESADIYFCRNNHQLRTYFVQRLPADGLFPTIYIHGLDAKWERLC